jgi:hypothetical protein
MFPFNLPQSADTFNLVYSYDPPLIGEPLIADSYYISIELDGEFEYKTGRKYIFRFYLNQNGATSPFWNNFSILPKNFDNFELISSINVIPSDYSLPSSAFSPFHEVVILSKTSGSTKLILAMTGELSSNNENPFDYLQGLGQNSKVILSDTQYMTRRLSYRTLYEKNKSMENLQIEKEFGTFAHFFFKQYRFFDTALTMAQIKEITKQYRLNVC